MSRIQCPDGPDAGGLWHCGDPLREQRLLTDGAGLIDLFHHDVVTITGVDRLAFLHSLTSQHLENLAPGESRAALVLSPTGHVEHGMGLVDDGETCWLHVEPGQSQALVDWLSSMVFMSRVEIAVRADLGILWFPGQGPDGLVARSAEMGGVEVFVDAAQHAQLVADAAVVGGTWAHEAQRIAAGVPRIGVDTDHRTLPNEIGLYGTHLQKGCYRGQETVARVHNLGRPPRRLIRLQLDGETPEAGSAIVVDGADRGFLGSAVMHHELGPIGLGLIKRNVPVEATLEVSGIAASQEALVDPEVGLHISARLGR